MNNPNIIVDDFRFIGGLHTTTRILPICSAILKIIGPKQLPLELLKKMAIEWSMQIEESDLSYSLRKGKLTDRNKKTKETKSTTSFEHYIHLLQSFGLLHRTGNIITTTRLGSILNLFSKETTSILALNDNERIFYILHIFNLDADALLLLLSILFKMEEGISQKNILVLFKEYMTERINVKRDYANTTATEKIRDWYLKITTGWEKPEIYAEHLLVPRLEWIAELGFVKITKSGSQTNYKLSQNGAKFYESIPILENSNVRDVNESWLRNNIVSTSVRVLPNKNQAEISSFPMLSEIGKAQVLGKQIEAAFKIIDTSGALRISLYPTFLYISTNLFVENKLILEFSVLADFLKNPISFNSKKYFIKESARITESYITISL